MTFPIFGFNFNSTKVQFGGSLVHRCRWQFPISIPLRYNLELTSVTTHSPFATTISIPLRYNLEKPAEDKVVPDFPISIPLRYNLEFMFFLFKGLCSAYFNSTKVQFGDNIRNRRSYTLFYFNSTKVQFGVHRLTDCCFDLRNFNSTKVQFGGVSNINISDVDQNFNSTKVQFGVLRKRKSFIITYISIPLRYNLEIQYEQLHRNF